MPPKKRAKVYSRTFVGCWTCRRRKIKCDATRPHCLRCTKSKLNCEGYGIKLNWSIPLVIKNNNEFGELNDDASDVEEPSAFQRSNIQLCKWSIYDYYEDIDDDLELLELNNEHGVKGPFTVFRYKEYHELQLPKSIIPGFNSTSSNPSTPIPIIQSETIHQNLIPFAKLSMRIQNLPSTTPLKLPFPTTHIPHPNINPPVFNIINEDSIVTSKKLLNSINYLINIIPILFHNQNQEFINYLENLIKSSIGDFILDPENKHHLYLLTTIQLASVLHSINIKNYLTHIDEIISLHQFIKSLHDLNPNHESEQITLATIIFIMINSTLGVYDPELFKHDIKTEQSPSSIHQMYKFITSIDQLLNSQQYQMDHKYSKFYEDLNQNYNLLTDITTKPKNMKNGYGKIIISTQQTSRDQIIKIPKHRTIEDEISSDEDDERPPPPTFHINFASAEDEDDDDDDDDDEEDYGPIEGEFVLFADLDTIDTQGTTIFGISKILIYVFKELVKLINHKRIFNKIGMTSRNFPKVIADFEDLLIRVNEMYRIDDIDDLGFYNCLVLLYYKLVRNYPSHMLNYHFKQIDECLTKGCSIEIIWFIKNALDKDKKIDIITNDRIWFNNWISKQLIIEMNQLQINDDWDTTLKLKKINGLFIL